MRYCAKFTVKDDPEDTRVYTVVRHEHIIDKSGEHVMYYQEDTKEWDESIEEKNIEIYSG